ncbi:response regulator [Halorhabdus salina]|uniref:response regulator n=1 Tax=Halorhabdus salina TaxID=2750670 RepID=UPI0015EED520|nr:response regulator [Halorhabdus salina]
MLADRTQGVDQPDPLVVLVVDDDPAVPDVAATYLEQRLDAVETIAETSPLTALDRVESDPSIDCLVSDYQMPEIDGLELHERVADRRPDLPFILFTATAMADLQRQVAGTGIVAFVQKDGSAETFDQLTAHVEQSAT